MNRCSPARRRSLRGRLGFSLGIRLLLLWLLVAIAVTLSVRHELDELYDASLQSIADVVAALEGGYSPSATTAPLSPADHLPLYRVRESAGPLESGISDREGERVLRFPIGSVENGDARVLEIAQTLAERREVIIEIALAILLPVFIVVPLALLGLHSALGRELAPLDGLGAQIARRGENDLSPLAPQELPEELIGLVDDVNHLLARLRRALEAEQSFAANSAHEFRTPLAGALAQLQRLRSETGEPETKARASIVEQALGQLQRLTEKLLELARADGAGIVTENCVDLASILPFVVEELSRNESASERLMLEDDGSPLLARLDPDIIHVLLKNLVENALRHGDVEQPVQVRRTGSTIEIINGGATLPAEEYTRLADRFERGQRGSGVRAEGAGLGLAIIHSIVSGGGIALDVVSPCNGQQDGVCMKVTLPSV